MVYSNSSMASLQILSPNYSARRATDEIDRITIHHMAGMLTAQRCGEIFLPSSRGGSSNYGVDGKGTVGLYVEEKNRAWTSSNRENDFRAVTIEVANDMVGEPWSVSNTALETTIKLCADICRRYGKTKVIEISDQIENLGWTTPQDRVNKQTAFANGYKVPAGCMLLTQHIYFATTVCPGTYLRSKWKYICQRINEELGNPSAVTPVAPVVTPVVPSTPVSTETYVAGEQIKLRNGCTYANGRAIPSWVFEKPLYYRGVSGTNIIFSTQKTGAITGTVRATDVSKISTATVVPTESNLSTKIPPADKRDSHLSKSFVVKKACNLLYGPDESKYAAEASLPVNTSVRCWGYYSLVSGKTWLYVTYNKFTGYVLMDNLK